MQRGDFIELNLNIPMDRALKIDEKNGVHCLVIMFTSIALIFKLSEIADFVYFLVITVTSLSQFKQYMRVHMEEIIDLLQKMVWFIDFGLNCLSHIVDKYQKNFCTNKGISKPCIFKR